MYLMVSYIWGSSRAS